MSCTSLPSQSNLVAKINSTPMSNEPSGSGPNSSTTSTRDERFEIMWSEIHKYVVGPMPTDDFLQRFLRSGASSVQLEAPSVPNESLEVYVSAANKDKCKIFIAALQPICSNFELKDTHDTPMADFQQFTVRPDVCVVDRDTSHVDITNVEIWIELKPDNYYDPFDDKGERSVMKDNVLEPEKFFVKETEAGQDTFGQSALYAAAHQAAQFRTHIFSILVFHNYARLMRWDRSGVIVTEKISIFSPFFVEFFHLYDHATSSKRGIDISVTLPSPENESKARTSLDPLSTFPLVQLSLGPSSYIVFRKPYMNETHSPLGRSTRTFIAYSISDECNYFLKDSWRLESQTAEHEIYRKLHSKSVPNIPTVVDGGDILDHTTVTQDVLRETFEWLRAPSEQLKMHKHYRLVLREIATPLRLFSSAKLLVTAIHDAMKAHRAAYFDAEILHRDISVGNIMIYNNTGLLIDWDLSKGTKDNCDREVERTGTWQFMSAHLQKKPTAAQGLIDDVESFIHVITWVSFQYAKHTMGPLDLRWFMKDVFDWWYLGDDGFTKGGNNKLRYFLYPFQLEKTKFDSPNLKELLLNITRIFAARYETAQSSATGSTLSPAILEIIQKDREERQETLQDSTWIISQFASALSNPDWSDEDKASKPEVIQIPNTEGQSSALKRTGSESLAAGKNKKCRTFPVD